MGDEKYQSVNLKYPSRLKKKYSWDFSPQLHQNWKVIKRRILLCVAKTEAKWG